MELVARFTLRRPRSSGPVCLEQRAGNIGHSQFVFVEKFLRILNLFRVECGHILVPHGAEFDPMQPEVTGHNLTCLFEVLRDLVIDYRQPERAGACARFPRRQRFR